MLRICIVSRLAVEASGGDGKQVIPAMHSHSREGIVIPAMHSHFPQHTVIPAKAGIHPDSALDSRLRGNGGWVGGNDDAYVVITTQRLTKPCSQSAVHGFQQLDGSVPVNTGIGNGYAVSKIFGIFE